MGQFQRESKKVTATGKAANDKGKWVYFQSLMFLKDKNRPRTTLEAGITDNLETDENFENVPEDQVFMSHAFVPR